MILPLLLAVTVSFHPPAPRIGEPITVRFREPVTIHPSPAFEIVSAKGQEVVLRTFNPEPLVLSGTVGTTRFRGLRIPIRSVLQQGDDLKPAPLAPPRAVAASRVPLIAMGVAALLALAAWLAVWFRFRRGVPIPAAPSLPADAVFRNAVGALRADPGRPMRWAELADATRRYLAASSSRLSPDLTSAEVLARREEQALARVLRQGDLEKFSPWGARGDDFDDVAAGALVLIEPRGDVER